MPGPTAALCTFPDDFVQEALDTVRRRTVSVQAAQRFRLVLLFMSSPPLGNDEAAAVVGLSARQVQRWRSRWAAGDFSIEDQAGRGRKAAFSPLDQALMQAMACEVIAETKEPLSRQSLADLVRRATRRPWTRRSAAARCGGCCTNAAIKPWQYEHWLFPTGSLGLPRRPGRSWICMRERGKASRWARRISCCRMDEKTSIQARRRVS